MQKDAFLAAAFGTQIGIALTKRVGAGFFGGEGLVLTTLQGHGTVWLQSLPFARMADRIIRASRVSPGGRKGESGLSALSGFFGE